MIKHLWMGVPLFAAVLIAVFAAGIVSAGCGSGACQQSPCVPGIPIFEGTCKCVATEDAGPPFDAASSSSVPSHAWP